MRLAAARPQPPRLGAAVRWTRTAASLFALPRPVAALSDIHETARRVLSTLHALAPVALSGAPIGEQIFAGAASMP